MVSSGCECDEETHKLCMKMTVEKWYGYKNGK